MKTVTNVNVLIAQVQSVNGMTNTRLKLYEIERLECDLEGVPDNLVAVRLYLEREIRRLRSEIDKGLH